MLSHGVSVSNYMTPMPYTVSAGERLDQAAALMQAFKVHHLPVVEGERIVGVLSDRDLRLVKRLREEDPDLHEHATRELMDAAFYCVAPQTTLGTVASHMAEHHLSVALVVQESGRLVGIFTDHDAMRALACHLHSKVPIPA